MVAVSPLGPDLASVRLAMRRATLASESDAIARLLSEAETLSVPLAAAQAHAIEWVTRARKNTGSRSFIDMLLAQAPLNSAQGRALMSLAEALLRTPDRKAAAQLVAEQLAAIRDADGEKSAGLALALLEKLSHVVPDVADRLDGQEVSAPVRSLALALARSALRKGMRMTADVFIAGETIEGAMSRAKSTLCSFDMLGEGARTEADATLQATPTPSSSLSISLRRACTIARVFPLSSRLLSRATRR